MAKRQPPQQASPQQASPSKRSQILDGIVITVASTIIVGLLGYVIVAQKTDIIQTLREELNKSKIDLLAELQKEREGRFKLAIALREAGIDIPMNVLFSYASSTSNPEQAAEIASEFASTLPLLQGRLEYLQAAERNAREGRDHVVCSKLPNGTGILAFSSHSFWPDRPSDHQAKISFLFPDSTTQVIQVSGDQCLDLPELLQSDQLVSSSFYRVHSIEPLQSQGAEPAAMKTSASSQ